MKILCFTLGPLQTRSNENTSTFDIIESTLSSSFDGENCRIEVRTITASTIFDRSVPPPLQTYIYSNLIELGQLFKKSFTSKQSNNFMLFLKLTYCIGLSVSSKLEIMFRNRINQPKMKKFFRV